MFPIRLPPLRERRDDIPRLLQHVAGRIARRLGRQLDGIAPGFVEAASAYGWPGNVRELENVVERALIVSRGGLLDGGGWRPAAPATAASADVPPQGSLRQIETAHIRRVLDATHWAIEGEAGAARVLGLHPSTLRGRMRKLGLRKGA